MGRQVVASLILLAGMLAGCQSSEESEQTPLPKEPNVSAEQAQKNLQESNLSPKAKEVLGGQISSGKE